MVALRALYQLGHLPATGGGGMASLAPPLDPPMIPSSTSIALPWNFLLVYWGAFHHANFGIAAAYPHLHTALYTLTCV